MVQRMHDQEFSDGMFYCILNNKLFLKGFGRLCITTLGSFFNAVRSIVHDNHIQTVFLDLAECSYLDSTILGNLVGIHKLMVQLGDLEICHPSHEAQEMMYTMGLNRILHLSDAPLDFPDNLLPFPRQVPTDAHNVLKAHTVLSDLSPENAQRFASLKNILERQIKK